MNAADERCHVCDVKLMDVKHAEEGCNGCPICRTSCWSEIRGMCPKPPVDWRARALAAKDELARWRGTW